MRVAQPLYHTPDKEIYVEHRSTSIYNIPALSATRVPCDLMNQSFADKLSVAVSVLIRPLIRLFLQHGVTYPQFIKLVRSVYVDVADREFRIPGKSQTDSRVTLLTGIHRRYVKALREEVREELVIPPNASIGGQLIGTWLSDERFLDHDQHPLRLPRTAEGGGVSFDDLVRAVTTDLRPRAILDELVRLGLVQVDAAGDVRLVREAFVPSTGVDEKLYFFGRNLHDHIAAGAHNVSGHEPRFLERSAYNSELTKDSVSELAAYAEQQAMQALQNVHRRAVALRERDRGKPDATQRVNFGAYFYADAETAVDETDDDR